MKRIFYYICVTLVIVSCTTQKNTLITRTYHNITSQFNIIFNGRESFRKGLDYIKENYEDDYSRVLPIFRYDDENVASSIANNMDRTLDKGTKVITLHSIKVKPERKRGFVTEKEQEFYNKKEFNKWMDENYILMGKAHFYKMDYHLAMETFRFILNEFPNEEETKNTTYIWMARTHIQLNEFREADDLLERLSNITTLTDEQQGELLATFADFHLKQEQYEGAIKYLDQAIDYISKKGRQIRYTFILAQLHLKLENYVKASQLFDEVIRMNPPYEMTFNAKINRALAFEGGSGSGEEIKKQLQEMLKDDKNIDYQDQIYYALGVIAMKENKMEEAISLFQKSANVSVTNDIQKARSYLELANIYYERPDYLNAQAYFDSTYQLIEPNFPNYEEIKANANSLGKLVTNLHIVEREDSLQRIAAMPEAQQLAFIDNIIEQVIDEERLAKEREIDMQRNMQYSQSQSRGFNQSAQGGEWYFYNPAAKSVGQPEFRMKWGNRKLEDNWRRKNKAATSSEVNSLTGNKAEPGTGNANEQQVTDNKSREFYIQNLPKTDSALNVSHQKIQEALYNLGLVYKDELNDEQKSAEVFEDLIERYPESELSLLAYYSLYKINMEDGNDVMANFYKEKIINTYPDSPFAKVLINPDYVKQLEEEQNRVSIMYNEAYDLYNQGLYTEVINKTDYLLNEYPTHELVPKIAYLKAVATGKQSNDDAVLRNEMTNYIANYPNSAPIEFANAIINYIDEAKPEIYEATEAEIAEEIYNYNPDTVHYVGFVVNSERAMNQLVFNLINYNLDNYQQQQLKTDVKMLNEPTQLITVSSFQSLIEAKNYYQKSASNQDIFNDVDISNVEKVIISVENYTTLLDDKTIGRYLTFFQKHYQLN